MAIDERQVRALTEQSEDVHSDGMRATRAHLAEVVEGGLEHRARSDRDALTDRREALRRSLVAAGTVTGLGALFLRRAAILARADNMDVVMLQTSASIENLAVTVYNQAAGLPPATSGAAIPAVKDFIVATIAHHTEHAKAFNGAVQKLGGKPQTQPDMAVLKGVVQPAVAAIKGPADVVNLALTLEDAAVQTYVKFAGVAVDVESGIKTWASIAPIEAQHVSTLLAVRALLQANAPQLIAVPLPLAQLPGIAGAAGLGAATKPAISFYPSTDARPADEGKVG